MAQVALAQKPLEVAVADIANSLAVKRGPFVAVALRVGLVALLAVFTKYKRAGGNCFGLASQGIGPNMIFCGNALPVRVGSRAEYNR